MSQEKNRVLAGELVSRASVELAAGKSLDEALTACDFDGAASIALARAKAGDPADAHAISRILAGIEFPPIATALISTVRDKKALFDGVTGGLYPRTKDAAEIETLALYAAWKAGVETARIIPALRRLAARQLTAEAYALLSTIAESIDDANVKAACKPIATFAKEYAKSVASDGKAMSASIDTVLAGLPANVESSRGGFTVRAASTVGRNDPCPCGSGLKYKKCCADKPQAATATPSPIPGVTWDEFLAGDKLAIEHINELALKDLVRVDVKRLADKPLVGALRKFAGAHQWTHALRVVEAAAGRPPPTPEETAAHRAEAEASVRKTYAKDPEELAAALERIRTAEPIALVDELRDELIHDLLAAGNHELAREEIRKLPMTLGEAFQFELALDDRPEGAWQALVEQARGVVATSDRVKAMDLAYGLLRAEPVLGILAARACIGAWLVDDPELLLEAIEEARDRLNLPPTDPAWDVYDTIMAGEKKPKKTDGDANLREAMADSSAKIDQLERALAAVRTELADARTRPVAELVRQSGGDQRDKLGDRVRELEALIREGNEERRELRKQLETAAPAEDRAPAPAGDDRLRRGRVADEGTDDDDGDVLEPGSRNIAIPRFERRALDALAEVPATVAAETMRTVGTLAAGDPYAWRGVKAAKDMPRQVLMGRVGIHHRLIFRSEGGNLDVIDLITREQLQTTLKRLRQGR
ncbi:MAG TPA: SEC-C metal-binding domain-containing protein [Planctomycetota bacterium]|nr:SEC-C metal-binding domain-containing protein [Planctomycetota bacterium]